MLEKACFLDLPTKGQCAFATLTTDIAIARSKTLECPTAVENKDNETKGENLPALVATCENLQHRREKTKRLSVPAQHTDRKDVFGLRTQTVYAKHVQQEAETTQGRERIRQFMFAVALQAQHKTFSHTCMK